MPVETQVIVIGAGPVGLLLAAELRLGGADVAVVETRATFTTESRASTLHARTMEILDSRGLLDALGTPRAETHGHFGGLPLDLTLPSSHPGQWKILQADTERVLQDWALSLGADIRRRHTLRDLQVRDDGVLADVDGPDGALQIHAKYVVACDGEDSTVRRLTGVGFPGRAARREMLRADVVELDVPDRRFERRQNGLAVAARRPDGVTRVMVHERGRAPQSRAHDVDFPEISAAWQQVTGEDISSGRSTWVNSFDDASHQVTAYRYGRLLFAGDAAHRQLPVGGQALNLGLQDAFNLGWKLAAHLGPNSPEGLLDSYSGERHPVGRRVLANIQAQTELLLGGPDFNPLRDLLAGLLSLVDVREHLAGMISGLDVRYDIGVGDHGLLGARVPLLRLSSPSGPTSLAARLRTGKGLLLDLSGGALEVEGLRTGWDARVEVLGVEQFDHGLPPDGAARGTDGALRGDGLLLIRPDGHLAYDGRDLHDAASAMTRWFGAGRHAA